MARTAPITLIALAFLACAPVRALDEVFEIYNYPQALAMGNAFSADTSGLYSLFYNPAGLAKNVATKWDVQPVAIDGIFNGSFAGTALADKSLGMYRILNQLPTGAYQYLKASFTPGIARRGFGLAFIGNYDFAALSDGTTVDARAGTDVGMVVGGATNLASNMLKIGVAGKVLLRNQLLGQYAVASLSGDNQIQASMKEGLGIGVDVGMMLTLPMTYLPTLAITWKDALGTAFRPFTFLNPWTTTAPDTIGQSFNAAFSFHPAVGRGMRALFSVELKHIEQFNVPLRKRLHFGFQFVSRKRLYFWAGMNQLFPTGGVGLRVPGGDFELGTYAQDTGAGDTVNADRRFFFRYTIGF